MRIPILALVIVSWILPIGAADAQNKTPGTGAAPIVAPSSMSNGDVIRMVRAGLGEPLIIVSVRRAQSRAFDLSVTGLIALKTAGVSDTVIGVMLEPGASTAATLSEASQPPAPNRAANPTTTSHVEDLPSPLEIGAYYLRKGIWTELLPEVVNWTTGGVLKHVASMGLVSRDVNGFVAGATSKTSLKAPGEILIYTADGVAVTEYQLLWLRPHSDRREFRAITGGIMHASGGATRDSVSFEPKKLAPRTYRIPLPDLEPGEYGILAPGLGSSSATQIGKMYTFAVD